MGRAPNHSRGYCVDHATMMVLEYEELRIPGEPSGFPGSKSYMEII